MSSGVMLFANEQCIHILDDSNHKWKQLALSQITGPRLDTREDFYGTLQDKRVPFNGKVIQINRTDVYMIGGMTKAFKQVMTTYKIDIAKAEITQCADMLHEKTAMGITSIGSQIYVVGGFPLSSKCE